MSHGNSLLSTFTGKEGYDVVTLNLHSNEKRTDERERWKEKDRDREINERNECFLLSEPFTWSICLGIEITCNRTDPIPIIKYSISIFIFYFNLKINKKYIIYGYIHISLKTEIEGLFTNQNLYFLPIRWICKKVRRSKVVYFMPVGSFLGFYWSFKTISFYSLPAFPAVGINSSLGFERVTAKFGQDWS